MNYETLKPDKSLYDWLIDYGVLVCVNRLLLLSSVHYFNNKPCTNVTSNYG